MMKPHARPELTSAYLVELLSLDDVAFKKRFAGTPMLRTKRRGILRNVCVALGNVGDESAIPALEKAMSDSEPLIAEHAEWALLEIKLRIKNTRIEAGDRRSTACGPRFQAPELSVNPWARSSEVHPR
jgi:hypothetical protein